MTNSGFFVISLQYILLLATQQLTRTHSLDNGLALTPPMGWLSWERFGCNVNCKDDADNCISESLYLQQAQRLVLDGYRNAGYTYVNMDDCWSLKERDNVTGKLVADPDRFPHGMRWLSDQLHSLDLKLGLYGDIGTATCAGRPGFQDSFELDAQTLAHDFHVDSIKVDVCNSDSSKYNVSFPAFGRALNRTGRPILYNCQWPLGLRRHGEEPPDALNHEILRTCNLHRNYYDVFDDWASVRVIVDYWSRTSQEDVLVMAGGPGHWNDPDMLVVGNPGLSISEQQAQFCLWAIFAAPLLLSADLRRMPRESADILLNKEVIAVNQDSMGHQGWCATKGCVGSGLRVYVRELLPSSGVPCEKGQSDTWAVVLANFVSIFKERAITFDPKQHLPDGDSWGSFIARDIVEHVDLSEDNVLTANIDESTVKMYRVVRTSVTVTSTT
jgi:alpha-N-acetylgalactosaminidase